MSFTSLFGVLFLAGCLALPLMVFGKTFPFTANFVELYLHFNHSWTTSGLYPDTEYASGVFCWSGQVTGSGSGSQYSWPYEGEETNAPTNSEAQASDFNWSETHYQTNYYYNAAGGSVHSPDYYIGTLTARSIPGCVQNTGSTSNQFIYVYDTPGMNLLQISRLYTDLGFPGLDHVIISQTLQDHGLYKGIDDGPTNTITIWYTNSPGASSPWTAQGYGS